MEKPTYILVQGHRIKVQQWQIRDQEIAITTIAKGDRSAEDILALVSNGTVSVSWEGMPPTDASIALVNHRKAGDGATAIHRITFAVVAEAFPRANPSQTVDDRIEAMLREIDRLRMRVVDLENRISDLEHIGRDD